MRYLRYPLAFLGLAAQVPLNPNESAVRDMADVSDHVTPKFVFKEAPDIFSPKDMVCNCFFPSDST
jgi:hypothetical protein